MFDIWTLPAKAVVHFPINLMLSGHARLGRNMDCDICILGVISIHQTQTKLLVVMHNDVMCVQE